MSVRFDADGEDFTTTAGTPGTGSFTALCWVKMAVDRNTYSTIFAFDQGDDGRIIAMQTAVDGVSLFVWGATSAGEESSPEFAADVVVGDWYRVAIVRDSVGLQSRGYCATASGTVEVVTRSLTDSANLTTFRAADSPGPSEWWNGSLANLKVYNAALTQSEIEAEWASWDLVRTSGIARHHRWRDSLTSTDDSGTSTALSGGSGAAYSADNPPISSTPRASVDLTDIGTSAMVTTAAAATTVAPTYPSNVVAGVIVYAYLHVRNATRTVTTPTDWALVGTFASTNTSAEGAGVGPTRTHVYRRVAAGALSGTQSFTISAQATSGVAQGYMRAFTATGTNVAYEDDVVGWSDPSTGTGAGVTTPTGSITVTAGKYAAKDVLQVSFGSSDSNTAVSLGSVTCTGATFSAATNAPAFVATENGNDMTTAGFKVSVTAGTNSGTTLSVPITQAAAEQMHGLVHRIRATADVATFLSPLPKVLSYAALDRAHNW